MVMEEWRNGWGLGIATEWAEVSDTTTLQTVDSPDTACDGTRHAMGLGMGLGTAAGRARLAAGGGTALAAMPVWTV